MKNAIGEVVTSIYDENGRLIEVKNTLGISIENYEYYEDSQVKSISDENGNLIESYGYDEQRNLVKVTDAFGNTSESIYSEKYGYVIKTINELNQETSYEYDDNKNITKVINGEGSTVNYEYNENGYIRKFIDQLENISTFNYNILNNLLEENLSTGTVKIYKYDSLNLIKEIINGRGQSIIYNYDKTDLPIEVDGTIFTYDGNGNILTVTNQEGTTTRTYDSLNRVTSFTNINDRKISYSYDEVSNLKLITYPDGEIVTYDYNLINQLIKVTDYKGRETTYTYDDRKRLSTTRLPNGSLETNIYNILDQPIQKVLNIKGIEYTINYEYDKAGKIISEELLEIPNDGDKSIISTLTSNMSMNYSEGNILNGFNNEEIVTDKDGNMIVGPLDNIMTDFTYDKLNKLTTAGNTTYYYDGEGTRIKQVTGDKEYTYVTDTISYLSRLLLKGNPDGTEIIYVYGSGLISQETKANKKEKIAFSDYRLFHYDLRGSTMALTNESETITDTYIYEPYGEVISHNGDTENIFKYAGKFGIQSDDNTLIFMRNRYYNTDIKRFINMDPIKDGTNWFNYVSGNPIDNVDLDGLKYEHIADLLAYYGFEPEYYFYDSNKISQQSIVTKGFSKSGIEFKLTYVEKVNLDKRGNRSSTIYSNRYTISTASSSNKGTFVDTKGFYVNVKEFKEAMCVLGLKPVDKDGYTYRIERVGNQDVHVHYYVINHKKEKLELSFGNDYENVNSFKAMAETSGAKVVTNASFFDNISLANGWTYTKEHGIYQNSFSLGKEKGDPDRKNNVNGYWAFVHYDNGDSKIVKSSEAEKILTQKPIDKTISFVVSGGLERYASPDSTIARTMLGIRRDGKAVLIVVSRRHNGKKSNTGMTIAGARKFFMDKMELLDVLNLDGSGSSQMYYNGDFVAQSSDDTLHGDVYVRAIGNILKVSNK